MDKIADFHDLDKPNHRLEARDVGTIPGSDSGFRASLPAGNWGSEEERREMSGSNDHQLPQLSPD
jgi:hypothetical protein